MAQFPSSDSAYGVWNLKDNRDAEMGDNWPQSPAFVAATGGTTYTDGDYKYHKFTSSGTFTVTDGGNAAGSNTVDYLIVAGGGGGGNSRDHGGADPYGS